MTAAGSKAAITRRIARVLREALEHGGSVDIDGLGTLSAGGKHGFRFVAQNKPRVFIAYVQEDLSFAKKLYRALEDMRLSPLAGQEEADAGTELAAGD